MPQDRGLRHRARQRRQSVRHAQRATRQALAELPASLRGKAGTATRPVLKETTEFLARATHPNIEFGVTRGGRLNTVVDVRGTARHEVAHHLGAGHPAIRAVAGAPWAGLNRRQVVSAVRIEREPMERRLQRAIRSRIPRG